MKAPPTCKLRSSIYINQSDHDLTCSVGSVSSLPTSCEQICPCERRGRWRDSSNTSMNLIFSPLSTIGHLTKVMRPLEIVGRSRKIF
jgi:hypothetical protein